MVAMFLFATTYIYVSAQPEASAPVNPVTPISLAVCLEEALSRNPRIASAAYSVDVAREALRGTKAAYRASVGLTLGTTKIGGPGVLGPDPTTYQLAASATYPLYTNGQREAKVAGAELEVESSCYSLESVRQQLALAVTSAYFDLLKADADVASAEQRVRRTEAHLALVEARIFAETAPRSERARALSDVESARATRAQALGAQLSARATLNQLLARPVFDELAVVQLLTPVYELLSFEAYQAQAWANRPGLLEAQIQLDAYAAQVLAVKRQKGVTLSLGASQSLGDSNFPMDSDNRQWSMSITASYPLFDGDRIDSALRSANATYNLQEENLRSLQMQVDLDVQLALTALQTAVAQLSAAEAFWAAAAEALGAATGRYEAGFGNLVELIDAETAYYEAELQQNQTRYALFQALAKLDWSIGKPLAILDQVRMEGN
jgi:outer membrane protein TolC